MTPPPRLHPEPTDPSFPHGTDDGKPRGYWWGCRCDECRAATARYTRERKAATSNQVAASPAEVPAPAPSSDDVAPSSDDVALSSDTPKPGPPTTPGRTASRGGCQRLRALITLGHTPVDIAHETRLSVDNIWWLLLDPPDTIQDVTHRILVKTYKTMLALAPIPETVAEKRAVDRAKFLASSHDWSGPLDWDDIDSDPDPVTTRTLPADTSTAPAIEERTALAFAERVTELDAARVKAEVARAAFTRSLDASKHVIDEQHAVLEIRRVTIVHLLDDLETARARVTQLESDAEEQSTIIDRLLGVEGSEPLDLPARDALQEDPQQPNVDEVPGVTLTIDAEGTIKLTIGTKVTQ